MDRRDALLIGATAAVGGWIAQKELLVGSDGSDGESGGESDSSPEPTESSDDSTPTDDSSSSSTPEIGQPFELSNVEYLVKTVRTAERLGSEMNPLEPEGVFVLTAVSVTNNRSEVIEFPGTNYRIRSRDTWSYQDEQATQEAPTTSE